MRPSRLVITFAVVTALAVAPAAAAHATFKGNVCKLVPTKSVTAIKGVSSNCTKGAGVPGPGATIYTAMWKGKTPQSASLGVTVSHYTDSGALALAVHNLKQGLPGGTPKKLTGIGSAAYEAAAAGETGLHFTVGKYVVYMTLTSVGKPSTASLVSLAKTIAAEL